MAVYNRFSVAESMLTELQILYRHAICKGQIHSWKYMCSDLYQSGNFQIILMISKSEAGTTLDRIKRDVGVANEIFIDNAPDHTSYNKEMQRVTRLARMKVQTTEPYSPWQKNLKVLLR